MRFEDTRVGMTGDEVIVSQACGNKTGMTFAKIDLLLSGHEVLVGTYDKTATAGDAYGDYERVVFDEVAMECLTSPVVALCRLRAQEGLPVKVYDAHIKERGVYDAGSMVERGAVVGLVVW